MLAFQFCLNAPLPSVCWITIALMDSVIADIRNHVRSIQTVIAVSDISF